MGTSNIREESERAVKTEQKIYPIVEKLIRSDQEWLGRAILKGVRFLLPGTTIHTNGTQKKSMANPTGPYLPSRPKQRGDLLIFVPRGWDSRLIDDLTGGYGYSHVAVDCGETDLPSGEPVMIESTVGQRVTHKFLKEYGERPFARIPLIRVGVDPQRFCECVLSKLGQPYDVLEALTLGEVDDPARQVCSDLAAVCLPGELRQDIAAKRRLGALRGNSVSLHSRPSSHNLREFISPNGFAEYFRAPRGKELIGPDQLFEPHPIQILTAPELRRRMWRAAACIVAAAVFVLWMRNLIEILSPRLQD